MYMLCICMYACIGIHRWIYCEFAVILTFRSTNCHGDDPSADYGRGGCDNGDGDQNGHQHHNKAPCEDNS